MMYPASSDNERSQHYLTIDPDGPLDESLSPIPYLPTPEEIVQLQDKSLIYVVSVASRTYTITGHKLRKIGGRHPRWTFAGVSQTHSLLTVVCSIKFRQTLRDFYIEDM